MNKLLALLACLTTLMLITWADAQTRVNTITTPLLSTPHPPLTAAPQPRVAERFHIAQLFFDADPGDNLPFVTPTLTPGDILVVTDAIVFGTAPETHTIDVRLAEGTQASPVDLLFLNSWGAGFGGWQSSVGFEAENLRINYSSGPDDADLEVNISGFVLRAE
jgi:hypothetical protein